MAHLIGDKPGITPLKGTSPKAVVDASVAVSLMLNPSLRAISAQLAGYDSLHAPGHFDVECTSAFRKAMLRGSLTFEQFGRLALAVPLFPVRRHLIGDLSDIGLRKGPPRSFVAIFLNCAP